MVAKWDGDWRVPQWWDALSYMDTHSVPWLGLSQRMEHLSTAVPVPLALPKSLSCIHLQLREVQCSLISWGWQPYYLMMNCHQFAGRLTLSPLKSGAKGLLASKVWKQDCDQEPKQHCGLGCFNQHITPEMLSLTLIWNYLTLPRWILHSFLMQNFSDNNCNVFSRFLIHSLLFK